MKNIAFLSHLDSNLYLFRLPIMRELLKRGYRVYAICPKGDKFEEFEEFGIEAISYKINRASLNPFAEKKTIANIYEAIKDLDLDILHTFTAKPNIYGTFAGKKAKVPYILNLVEGLGSFYTRDSVKNIIIRTIMERLYKKAFKLSNACVFVNSDDPNYMVGKNIIPKEKVKIIKSVGIDTKKFDMSNYDKNRILQIRKQNDLQDRMVVLMVARAIWDKGVGEFYEVAKKIKSLYEDVEFVLVGDTDEGNPTCASKEYLSGGSVKWLGHRDDIADLIAVSDIFVLPSYREGLPVTLMEAASMSKPIIATKTVGCVEVVDDGYNGFLTPVKDVEILSKKIEILIKDEKLRDSMGENGRIKIQKEFEISKIVKQYMELYEEVV